MLFIGCTKEDLAPAEPNPEIDTTVNLEDYVPTYPERTGILVSINNYTYENQNGTTVEKITGAAKAIFPDQSGNLRNAGNVAVQNVSLLAGTNNTYSFVPNSTNSPDFSFPNSTNTRWAVSGNGDIPAMNFICTAGFPSMSEMVTSGPGIDRQNDFTLGTTLPFDNADSVRFTVFASNGYLFASSTSQHNSHTFESSKLLMLNAGTGYIRVTAFRTVPFEINGITLIQYINESVVTKQITIK